MLASYLGCKIVNAEPEAHKDGRPGYAVYYPDGYVSWSPKDTFEAAYRLISAHERQVMNLTEGEASIARISDGDPETEPEICPGHPGGHQWTFRESSNRWVCDHCPAERVDNEP